MRGEKEKIAKYFIALEYWKKDQNSTGYFWSEAIREMRSKGLHVDVIHPKLQGSDQAAKPYARYQNAAFRTLKKLSVSVRIALLILFLSRKTDCVVCGTNPELLPALIVLVQKLKRFRTVVLVHDVFPENALVAGVVRGDSRLYRILRTAISWVYRQPDQIVVIGRDMKELIEREKGRSKRTVFIPNWVDHADVTPMDRRASAILADLGWEEKIVFQFFGNIGRLQGVDNLLLGIDRVDHPKAAFLFVGNGVRAPAVQDYCKTHPERAVKYFTGFPDATRSDVLAACDVALVSLSEGMYGLGVPSKAYFSMASDRPIFAVVDKDSEIDRLIAEEQIGWVCRPGDPEGFAQAIHEICEAGPGSIAGSPRRPLLERYSKESSLDQFVNVVEDTYIWAKTL